MAISPPHHGSDSESEPEMHMSMFEEPPSFRPEPPLPSFIPVTLPPPLNLALSLRLVGHNPLWGHHLWNAGRVLSTYLSEHADRLVTGKDIFELGAGAGLPGITAWAQGAKRVVLTDYPDVDLIDNLQINLLKAYEAGREAREGNAVVNGQKLGGEMVAAGYVWGAALGPAMEDQCDTLIMGDLLFNHSEHDKLVQTAKLCLRRRRDCVALVFFTPYRPWLIEKDRAFLSKIEEAGFTVRKVVETVMDKVMFEKDEGDELLRRTVYGYEIGWKDP